MTGSPFYYPVLKPVNSTTKALPLASFVFTVSGSSTTQALVYRDAYLRVPYRGNPTADDAGNFKPIYLDSKTLYGVKLVDALGNIVFTVDPYIPPMSILGPGTIQVNASTGEVSIGPPGPGASGAALTTTSTSGAPAIQCKGSSSTPGPLLDLRNTLATGAQTPSFANATNKPGAVSTTPTKWLPIIGDGGITYYIPCWI